MNYLLSIISQITSLLPDFSLIFSKDNFHYLVLSAVVIAVSLLSAYLMRRFMGAVLRIRSEILRVDPTNYAFLKNAIGLIIFSLAFFVLTYAVPPLHSLAKTIFASAGLVAAVVGFASQQALSNIVGGIFIVIFKPFRVGDFVEVGIRKGEVEDITLRHTVIKDAENRRIIIPNAEISASTIVNNHIVDERIHRKIEFRVAMNTDFQKASAIMMEEAKAHPNYIDGRTEEEKEKGEPELQVRLTGFGEYFMVLTMYVWAIDSGKAFELHTDLNLSIKLRFEKEGVEIPMLPFNPAWPQRAQ